MSDHTTNLNLTLPSYLEDADIAVLNENFTKIDTAVAAKASTSSLAAVATSGAYADLTGKPTVDAALDAESTNAVQNAAVAAGLSSMRPLVLGTAIPNGADLNSYTTAGKYYRSSGGTTNLPNGFNSAYFLIVEETTANNRYRQWLFPAAAASAGEFYSRISTGDAVNWQSWYKFSGTAVT